MRLAILIIPGLLAACDQTVTGNVPIGGSVDTDAEIQRFVRRAYLDLSSAQPTQAELDAGTTRLRDAGNTPSARAALTDELLAQVTFPASWVDELEAGVFGGLTLEQHFAQVCGLARAAPECSSCTATDSCACTCAPVARYAPERDLLRESAAALGSGTTTSTLERRYASAYAYWVLSPSPEGRVTALFDDFLARTPEPDELENGRSIVIFQDGFLGGAPVGLLFHRHATNYADMIDILFDSEVYREAMVKRSFQRYLARTPEPAELAHFTATLDATDPDMRPLVRAVVSSREYFEQ